MIDGGVVAGSWWIGGDGSAKNFVFFSRSLSREKVGFSCAKSGGGEIWEIRVPTGGRNVFPRDLGGSLRRRLLSRRHQDFLEHMMGRLFVPVKYSCFSFII